MSNKNKYSIKKIKDLYQFLRMVVFFSFVSYLPSNVHAAGSMPIPNLDNPSLDASVSYDSNVDLFTYQYVVNNPVTSIGDIWQFKIDITQKSTNIWNFGNLKIPFGSKSLDFYYLYNKLRPFYLPEGHGITPIGQELPSGWVGGFGRDGKAMFSSRTGTPMITPGQSASGFDLLGPGLPIIREAELIPNWVLVIEEEAGVTAELQLAADEVHKNIRRTTYTLGPAGILDHGSFTHWNLLRENIDKAIELGWVTDQTFISDIKLLLKSARDAINLSEGKFAKLELEKILTILENTTDQQRKQAFHDLLFYHLKALITYTDDIPRRVDPKITLTPEYKEHPLGVLQTFTAKVVNLADENVPIEGFYLYFHVESGPHRRTRLYAESDENGEAKFQYIGTKAGIDHVVVEEAGF
ncbi:MAG: hypothetical protein OQJ77_04200 [Thiovulaceae bacterium]|nr:hypothetical protein [Sulfurimonadaceae bacterium]